MVQTTSHRHCLWNAAGHHSQSRVLLMGGGMDLGPTWPLLGASYFFLITQAWPRLSPGAACLGLTRIDQMLTCEALSQMWGFYSGKTLEPIGTHTVQVRSNSWGSTAGQKQEAGLLQIAPCPSPILPAPKLRSHLDSVFRALVTPLLDCGPAGNPSGPGH